MLVLAYDFPPLISIGGQRPYSWLRYLPEFGFQVTVVTRHWSETINSPTDYITRNRQEASTEVIHQGKIIRGPFKPNLRDELLIKYGLKRFGFFRKALSVFYSYAEHMCFAFDAKSNIYRQAFSELNNNKYDLIVATGEPFILFRYAHKLSQVFNVPWIADYRDCWTSNQQRQKLGVARRLLNSFFAGKEKAYLSNVSLITTPSPDYADKLKEINRNVSVEVVYNGYDNDVFEAMKEQPLNPEVFTISYAGTLYPHQNIEMFLEGVKVFQESKKLSGLSLKVNFYGLKGQEDALKRIAAFTDLQPFLFVYPRVPYSGLIELLRSSHVLLLLSSPGMRWLNAKIFDYLAVNRPILLVQNDEGILRDMILSNSAGWVADSKDDVAKALTKEYEKFLSGAGVSSSGERPYKYSRKAQAQKMAVLMEQTTLNLYNLLQ